MPDAQIASSHYEPDGYGDARKVLVNLYAEKNQGDPARPFRLVNTPGSRIVTNGAPLATGVRGLFQADGFAGGKIVVPDGATVRLHDVSAASWSTLSGTISGSDRVRVAFGEVQAGFLAGGALYQSDGSAVAALSDADWATLLSDAGETAYSSIAVMGQRLLASYGSRFAFSDALDFDETTTLSWYTAENSPDGIIALAVLGSTLMVFGTQTIEPWVETGNNDDPFNPITGQVIDRGAVARDTIVKLDNTLFWIGDDLSVYRLNGLTPQMLNPDDAWISRYLAGVDPADIKCSAIETEAHKQFVIWTPGKCLAYDVATNTWHKRETYGSDTWEWRHHVRVGSRLFAANGATTLVELSRDYKSDRQADAVTFGTEIVRSFTAHLPVKSGRPALGQIRLEAPKGVGLIAGQGADPLVAMAISRDKGNTFGPWRERSLGGIGRYSAWTAWEMNGRAGPEMTVLMFRCSDPVSFLPSRVAVNER